MAVLLAWPRLEQKQGERRSPQLNSSRNCAVAQERRSTVQRSPERSGTRKIHRFMTIAILIVQTAFFHAHVPHGSSVRRRVQWERATIIFGSSRFSSTQHDSLRLRKPMHWKLTEVQFIEPKGVHNGSQGDPG